MRTAAGRWLTVVLLLVPAPGSVAAQQVMVTGVGSTLIDLSTGTTRWTSDENLVGYWGGLVSADGAFTVGVQFPGTGSAVRVTDMTTGSYADAPMSFEPRVAHPRDRAFFGLSGGIVSFGFMSQGTPARLDACGLTLYGGCPPLHTVSVDVSGDGARLFALCEGGQIMMIDTATGAVTDTQLAPGSASIKSNFDGTALLIASNPGSPTVELVDVATTAVLQSIGPLAAWSVVIGHISPDRRKAIIDLMSFPAPLPHRQSVVLDLETFTLGPALAGIDLRIASVSPDNRTAYSSSFPRIGPGSVQTHDLTTGAVTASASYPGVIVMSHAPLPPVAAATVTGNRVDLSWLEQRGSPVALAHALEIGTGLGLSDLGTVALGPEATLSVPGVPAGRYYVRVRARNVAGVSGPSNELVIDVP